MVEDLMVLDLGGIRVGGRVTSNRVRSEIEFGINDGMDSACVGPFSSSVYLVVCLSNVWMYVYM